MPDDRTTVTELATAIGTLGGDDIVALLNSRPSQVRISADAWDRLASLYASRKYGAEFAAAFANGRAFLAAKDGLRGRIPQAIEWTGDRRPMGDENAPIDIRIDHVFQISCKYLSSNIANASPARLFDGLLATTGTWARGDWYHLTAPIEYRDLFSACRDAVAAPGLPNDPLEMSSDQRRFVSRALRGRSYPEQARDSYARLCKAVSSCSASRWTANIAARGQAERMFWRLLRIGNAPYFVLGVDRSQLLRLRVASPWDWRQLFEFIRLDIKAGSAGQPQVNWLGVYRERGAQQELFVRGRAEIRWSHGRFRQPPEAKIYLETPVAQVPGYFALT